MIRDVSYHYKKETKENMNHMNPLQLTDNTSLVELIEDMERTFPHCPSCSEHNITVERDGALWLECSSLSTPKPVLRRLLTLDFAIGHTRRQIVEAPATRLAA
jgi:hypothetical protein